MRHVRIEDGPRLVVQAWLGSRVLLALVFVWVLCSTGTAWHDAAGNWTAPLVVLIAITLAELVPGVPAARASTIARVVSR